MSADTISDHNAGDGWSGQPGRVNLREIAPGAWLKLRNGRIVQVLDNPQDGMWVVVREQEEGEGYVFVEDVVAWWLERPQP